MSFFVSFKYVSCHEHLLAALFSLPNIAHWGGLGGCGGWSQAESLDRTWSSRDPIGSYSGIS